MIPVRTYSIRPDQLARAAARREQTRLQRVEAARATRNAVGKRVEDAKCSECGKTFRRLVRKDPSVACYPCRDRISAAARRAAMRPDEPTQPAKPPTKKRDQLAKMPKAKCQRCGKAFPVRQNSLPPPLCMICALKSLPPIDLYFGNEHPLCKS